MEVLWEESPLTAQDVAERIAPERAWSANTVKTLLGRPLAKPSIGHEADGRRYLYRPLIACAAFVACESMRLKDTAFGGRRAPLVERLAERGASTHDDIYAKEADAERAGGGNGRVQES